MAWTLIVLIVNGLLVIVVGVLVVVAAAKAHKKTEPGPRCGCCGYNLTGATTNRCPECGKLFIEAGINMHSTQPRQKTMWAVTIAVIFGVAILMMYFTTMRSRIFRPPVPPTSAPATQPVK